MKSYSCLLECSHTRAAKFDHDPAERHDHLPCKVCGHQFAVLRATEITPPAK